MTSGQLTDGTARAARPSHRLWSVGRLVGLALVVVVVCGTIVFGQHRSDLAHLEGQIRSGAVTHVTVEGALPPHSTGYGQVRLTWRAHGMRRFADVEQATSYAQLRQGRTDSGDSVSGHIIGGVDHHLRALAPGLRITHEKLHGLSGEVLLGWQVPTGLAAVVIALWILTVSMLVNGPQPRFATRWAWGWGLLSPIAPLVIVAYLLVASPFRWPADAQADARRLTGGWAFLLLVLFAGSIASRWLT